MGNKVFGVVVLLSCLAFSTAHEVATSHQSFVSGQGWRYAYGIAHGPHGIGHAVGESYPHGYGGFGTYAPAYGYNTHLEYAHPHPHPVAPHPVIIQVPVEIPQIPHIPHEYYVPRYYENYEHYYGYPYHNQYQYIPKPHPYYEFDHDDE